MRNFKLSIAAVLMTLPVTGFCLHKLNCQDAKGNYRREEKEIWGTNPVKFHVLGKEYKESELVIKTLGKAEELDELNKGEIKIYAQQIQVSRKDKNPLAAPPTPTAKPATELTTWIICQKFENGALD